MSNAHASDPHATEPWIKTGNRVLSCLGAGLLAFGLISISGAVVAPGVVNVETNYKTVQHLDGGIVAKILVRNGDYVKEGEPLLMLDDTAVRTSFAIALARVNDLLAQQARLEAERDRRDAIEYPPDVLAASSDPSLAKVLETQQALFDARLAARRGEQSVLRERIEQLAEEKSGLQRLLLARQQEAEINKIELDSVTPLYERGFTNQQRYLPIKREGARLNGEIGRLTADLARNRSSAAEVELKIKQSERDFTQAVVDELRKVQAGLSEAVEQRTALDDKLRRIVVRAPRTGLVHAIAMHTEGGVIQPAGAIMQIIPQGERLLVDAQLPPQDIDKVRKGQSAYVRFPAFNAKSTPRLEGVVHSVSPAQIADKDGRSHYLVQIALSEAELRRIPAGHTLLPGMPAEVYIETGARSILSYFIKPLLDATSRTFRES